MADNVNHPKHYCKGKIEVIDCIESLIAGRDPDEAYALGNAIKYIARAGDKDPSKYDEDLAKAIWYVHRARTLHHNKVSDFKVPEENYVEEIVKQMNDYEFMEACQDYAHDMFVKTMSTSPVLKYTYDVPEKTICCADGRRFRIKDLR